MHLGRERPPKTWRGTVIGGWQRGSLTPQMPPPLLSTSAPTARRAAQSAARLTVVKSVIAKNIATLPTTQSRSARGSLIREPRTSKGGPLIPSLCSPRLFFAFVDAGGVQGPEKSGREAHPRRSSSDSNRSDQGQAPITVPRPIFGGRSRPRRMSRSSGGTAPGPGTRRVRRMIRPRARRRSLAPSPRLTGFARNSRSYRWARTRSEF